MVSNILFITTNSPHLSVDRHVQRVPIDHIVNNASCLHIALPGPDLRSRGRVAGGRGETGGYSESGRERKIERGDHYEC